MSAFSRCISAFTSVFRLMTVYFGFYKCISANDGVFRLFESPQREEMHMKDNTKTKLHKINNKILR